MSKERSEEQVKAPVSGMMTYLRGLPLGALAIVMALSSLSTLAVRNYWEWQQPAPIYIQPAQPTSTPRPTATPSPIRIFINGEVNEPGIYELPHDGILQDALVMAGGFSADAFEDVVNLAQPLTDGMQVYVPAFSESAAVPLISTPPVTTKSADSGEDGEIVNLNTATKSQLETLPGVGPSTAQKILDYREDNGPFGTIEQVMDVAGIGPAKFESMAPYIIVDG